MSPPFHHITTVITLLLILFTATNTFAQNSTAATKSDADNPCQQSIAPSDDISTAKANEQLKKGLKIIGECGERIVNRAEALLRGDSSADWDGYNQDLQALADQYQEHMKFYTGAGGVIEKLKRVLAQMKRDIEDDQNKGKNPNEDPTLKALISEAERFEKEIKTVETNISGINKEIVELIALRPEIARRLRRIERGILIEDVEGLNKTLANIREAFTKQRTDPVLLPTTGD